MTDVFPAGESPELSIIIPNYNDGESAEAFLNEVTTALAARPDYTYEIILVDDGSSDGSQARLQCATAGRDNIQIIELVRNFGQQTALYIGLLHARGRIVVTVDGDGQYPAETIPLLADAIREGFDMASGIRQSRQDDWFSRATSQIGGALIRNLLGFQITDFGSLKALSRHLVDRVIAVQIGAPEVYSAALSWQPSLKEFPIPHRERMFGSTKWSLVKRLKLYFDLYFKYADDRFGLVLKMGIAIMTLSAVGALLLLLHKALFGHQESIFLIIAVSAMFFVTGLQLVLWSFTTSALKQISRQDSSIQQHMIRSPRLPGQSP